MKKTLKVHNGIKMKKGLCTAVILATILSAGVLLARVTQTKGKGEVGYVGINTGMNSLIRPALYGAFHEIVNLSRVGEPATQLTDVVGPICETGDYLGVERLMPPAEENDVILIANAGAYGRVMSSHYNLREPAIEIVMPAADVGKEIRDDSPLAAPPIAFRLT